MVFYTFNKLGFSQYLALAGASCVTDTRGPIFRDFLL
jgi:hypothetical protein